MIFSSLLKYRSYKNKADKCVGMSNYAEAINCYIKCLRINPQSEDQWLRMAKLCLEHDLYEHIDSVVHTCPESIKDSHEFIFLLGKKHESTGRIQDALNRYLLIIEKDTNVIKAYEAIYKLVDKKKNITTELIEDVLGKIRHLPDNSIKDYYEALLNLRIKKFELALAGFQRAERSGHDAFECAQALGILKVQQGDFEGAFKEFERTTILKPDSPDVFFNLGMVVEKIETEKSIKYYQKALDLDNRFLPALYRLGSYWFSKGELDKAQDYYQKTEEIEPYSIDSVYRLALIFDAKNDKEEAKYYYALVLDRDNTHLEATIKYAKIFEVEKNYSDALRLFETLELHSEVENSEFWFKKSRVYDKLKDLDASIECLNRAIQIDPAFSWAFNNLSAQLRERGELFKSLEIIEKALELDVQPAFLINKAVVLDELGNVQEAERCFEMAFTIEQNNQEFLWQRAMILLRRKEWQQGWKNYCSRWCQVDEGLLPPYVMRTYLGGIEKVDSVLVYKEQGLGDEIMFSSCIPDLHKKVDNIVIECNPKLEKIFGRSFPYAQIHASEPGKVDASWLENYPNISKQISAGNLPGIFRQRSQDFPGEYPFLLVDKEKAKEWADKLSELPGKIKIGLSWKGGTYKTRSMVRSTNLDILESILSIKGCSFVNLQYGDCIEELNAFKQKTGIVIHHFPEAHDDYDETAALCSSLDIVISVQTAVVHLCGALGVPVWCMLPKVPEWRYGSEGESMTWYPSVRLFRQKSENDWADLVKEIEEELTCYFFNGEEQICLV